MNTENNDSDFEKFGRLTLRREVGNIFLDVPDFLRCEFENFRNLNEREMITVLQRYGFLNSIALCNGCQQTIAALSFETGRHPRFRCRKRACLRKLSLPLYKNTIFDQNHIGHRLCLELLYQFSCRRPVSDSVDTLGIGNETVQDFYKLIRSSLAYFLEAHSEPLGGDGIVIHFDETPITHRHGILGRNTRSHTVWVVGAVDIYSKKCFRQFLPSRSREDLLHFVNLWVLPGSVIHTDSHASYNTLSSLGFTHCRVNHSRELVARDGTNTNWIEGLFGCLKKMIRRYDGGFSGVHNLHLYLSEFCFRYSFSAWNRKKAFLKIMYALKYVKEQLDQE
ncbi:hypothetical protein M153_21290001059 [Pseudoloma neurophilia]|uniref:ISXO2-like transposase domain-containing protein n=1 Tax=Pseudoloma neurophilia TaxID=146866 RepID=A0A0R0LU07_9MICR|nr:hypothetical protein M153_21290001059 [Pseudoloma neurophilia]